MDNSRKSQLYELLNQCGVSINSLELVNQALTHPTYVFENQKKKLSHNQRLEFLGDAVLDLIVAQYLYHRYPTKPEGELTKIRAAVVCEPTLARVARKINLGQYLLLGRGEELTGGRQRPSVLADAFEALIAAIYLDAGMEQAVSFVENQLKEEIVAAVNSEYYGDYKTILQERIQKEFTDNVQYDILKEFGPDHNKTFVAGVSIGGKLLATGQGKSKKEAEQLAAKAALEGMDG
ncbi:MAG: ribonuclease III [Thermoanaerobacteraceae bacterium]|nr:ribonuclease III [Thermoanaerobacteraceae bacterium]